MFFWWSGCVRGLSAFGFGLFGLGLSTSYSLVAWSILPCVASWLLGFLGFLAFRPLGFLASRLLTYSFIAYVFLWCFPGLYFVSSLFHLSPMRRLRDSAGVLVWVKISTWRTRLFDDLRLWGPIFYFAMFFFCGEGEVVSIGKPLFSLCSQRNAFIFSISE